MNAQVGRRKDSDSDRYDEVLGPYGLDARNKKGRDLLQVYQTNSLSIMNTFFDAPNHVTYALFNEERTECMLDMIAVSRGYREHVIYCRAVDDGVRSDHAAIRLTLAKRYSCLKTRAVPRITTHPKHIHSPGNGNSHRQKRKESQQENGRARRHDHSLQN